MHGRRMRTRAAVAAAIVLSAVAVAGCGNVLSVSDPAEVADEETLRELMDEDEFFKLGGPYEGIAVAIEGGGTREGIDPLNFWREVTERHIERDIWIDHEAGIAEVEVDAEVWGTFNIVDWEMNHYEKPLHHLGERSAVFEIDPDWEPGQGQQGQGTKHRRGRWILAEISGFAARSETCTVSIDWIRVESATVDTTITDPLARMSVPEEIMTFEIGDEVTVTVSGPPEDALVFLHAPIHRSPFQYQGDGTFQGVWTVRAPGPHCAWVEALARDSLFDSDYPEDVRIWGMPYEVARDGEIE
jgi:hypothetical protein